ncbi:MAG: hypothetical protein Q8P41_00815 [Pseudomonadota bacterium]|nr:hypothetical protein [Pseudomonadota bacterium]
MTLLHLLLACTGAPACSHDADLPCVAILSPAEEATVCGAPLVVDTVVGGVVLVDPFPDGSTEVGEAGTAHLDVALNGQEEDDWMFSGERIVMNDIEDGYYQLRVELSGADHRPIEPYAGDLVYITVSAGVCE